MKKNGMAICFSLFEKSTLSTSVVHNSYLVLQVTCLNVFFFFSEIDKYIYKQEKNEKKREFEIERERELEVVEEEEEKRGKYKEIWRNKCLR